MAYKYTYVFEVGGKLYYVDAPSFEAAEQMRKDDLGVEVESRFVERTPF